MIVTNLKIILGTEIPEKDMKALMKRLSDKAKKEIESVTGNAFPVVKEPWLHFENKFNILFPELKELFRSEDMEIVFRAIGDEVVQVPGFSHKLVKVMMTPEVKDQIAESMCQQQERKDEVEDDKKSHAKKCGIELDSIEKAMAELVQRYRRGYDEKEVKCVVQFDFENKVKNFLNDQTGEVVASEEMQPSDYQLKIDYEPGVTPDLHLDLPMDKTEQPEDLVFGGPEESNEANTGSED